jgi:hypothetical protein
MALKSTFLCFVLAVVAMARAALLPGRSSYVKHDSKCLVLLYPDLDSPLTANDFLASPASAHKAWVGLTDCRDYAALFPVDDPLTANQRLATRWMPDSDGRLRSFVQPHACLDLPEVFDFSYWVNDCEVGESDLESTFALTQGRLRDGAGNCLCPDHGSSQVWPVAGNSAAGGSPNMEWTPVTHCACTDQAATQWSGEASPIVVYPSSHRPTEPNAYTMTATGEGFSEAVVVRSFAPSNLDRTVSMYGAFDLEETAYPVHMRVQGPAAAPGSQNPVEVYCVRQHLVQNVHRSEDGSAVEFDLLGPGQFTILFTERPDDWLALFVDPVSLPPPMRGCGVGGHACDNGAIYIGPGHYIHGSATCDAIGNLGINNTDSTVYLAGGAFVNCEFSTPENGLGAVKLYGRGEIDGTGLSDPELGTRNLALIRACGQSVEVEGVVMSNPTQRGKGNLEANSPWGCNNGPPGGTVSIVRFKQIAGNLEASDSADVGPNAVVEDSFFDANDDVVKTAASNARWVSITIWIHGNGYAIEFSGWGHARTDVTNVTVADVDIHRIGMFLDYQCCGDACPATYPCTTCPSGQSERGKKGLIGGQIGGNKDYSDYSISNVLVRDPQNAMKESLNFFLRLFAGGITRNPFNSLCPPTSTLRDVRFHNIRSEGKGTLPVSDGSYIYALNDTIAPADSPVQGITFSQVFEDCPSPGADSCVPASEFIACRSVGCSFLDGPAAPS